MGQIQRSRGSRSKVKWVNPDLSWYWQLGLRQRQVAFFLSLSRTEPFVAIFGVINAINAIFLQVYLFEFNGKTAQFKIEPRYKVKSEGDVVQENDQVILESIKSPGQFLHASAPYRLSSLFPQGYVRQSASMVQ